MSEYILKMMNITKEFSGVHALKGVNLSVEKGEIHALIGENGAGKSTLMKILSGVYPFGTYGGKITINDKEQEFKSINDSENAGIAIIYQELALVKQLNVCENIFLGNEFAKKGIIDWNKSYFEAKKYLKEVRLEINPSTKVVNLGIGQQQLVEIAKAISKKADILILDEPTAALNETETQNLLQIILELKKKGVTCIYISHKLSEIFQIADSITVIRDGETVHTDKAKNLNEDKIISLMVGRQLKERFPIKHHLSGDVIMEVKNWTVNNPEVPDKAIIKDVSFSVKKGEILGIAGLMGSGRTELAMSLFGCYGIKKSGSIVIEDQEVQIKCPRDAINKGVSYVSEDRKRYGLILMMDIMENSTMSAVEGLAKLSIINSNETIRQTNDYVEKLNIKTPSIAQKTKNLSGGNQQKVVLAKWLMTQPKILILDEPTRGIDVGAKYEIYTLMNQLVEQGLSIIMISSELPEVLGMSDRILVMHEGKIKGELSWEQATQEKIMSYATGGM